MATSPRDTYITGLQNHHALENQLIQVMQRQVERYENYPMLTDRLRQHIEESRRHAARIEEILQSLGASHSTLKDVGTSIMGNLAAIGHALAQDEVVKNAFANYAAEHYEIASWRALTTMAEMAGDTTGPRLIQQSIQEEVDMARWLDSHLEQIVRTYTEREARGETAGV
jgi:ferritin-like metal-binding protein YciE